MLVNGCKRLQSGVMLHADLGVLCQQTLLKDCKCLQSGFVLRTGLDCLRAESDLHSLVLLGNGLLHRGAALAGQHGDQCFQALRVPLAELLQLLEQLIVALAMD